MGSQCKKHPKCFHGVKRNSIPVLSSLHLLTWSYGNYKLDISVLLFYLLLVPPKPDAVLVPELPELDDDPPPEE